MATDQPNIPPAAKLLDMITGHWVVAAIYSAARLSLADRLAAGPRSSDELAAEAGTHPDATYRVLRALAGVGIFDERPNRVFALNEMGDLLRADHPRSVRDVALFQGAQPHWQGWGNFLYSVQTGKSAFEHVHGKPFFDYCQEDEEFAAAFNGAMTCFSVNGAEAVVESYDFTGIRHLVDVGGGHGALLIRILQENPSLRGTVFDLPSVVEGAKEAIAAAGLTDRCGVSGGSFFDDPLPKADAYIAQHIIHDWDDEHCRKILQAMRDGLEPGGRVLIVDAVIEPGDPSPAEKLIDLEMLHATKGGRERTREEFAALFASAGLELKQVVPTNSMSRVIEAAAK